MRKLIVVSAVNIIDGGQLSILRECLTCLADNFSGCYEIVALVNSMSLLNIPNIKYYEFPLSKKSWFLRLYYEFYYFKKLARQIRPYLWLSLQDITPNVQADVLAVYCHNASPFYKLRFKDIWFDYKFTLFTIFYKWLYGINVKNNVFVIVQQEWLRDEFRRMFGIENIIVAHPSVSVEDSGIYKHEENNKAIFFFPSLPRVFKNLEVICEAVENLESEGVSDFEVNLTIDGTENSYSGRIRGKFGHLKQVRFIGIQSRKSVYMHLRQMDCMLFPSKLETWGLPISECKAFGKPMLVANLKYAKETVGEYDKVRFFDPHNARELAELMRGVITRTIIYDKTVAPQIAEPFVKNWKELFDFLLK